MDEKTALQDIYEENYSYCYGCGSLNEHGLHIKSYWDGDEVVAIYQPKPYHIALPGFVYGGLIASLIDCHSIAIASASVARQSEKQNHLPRYVTGSLKVDYLLPTPLGISLEVKGKALEIKDKKVIVETALSAQGKVCAKGYVVAVRMPESMA